MRKSIVLLLGILFCTVLPSGAQQAWQSAKEKGDAAYAQSDYDAAITHYETSLSALPENSRSAGLFHNLANAHYQSGHLGEAILYWEKALAIAPNARDSRKNLAIARKEIKGEVYPVKPFFLVEAWKSVRSALRSRSWGIIGLLLLWLGAGLLLSRIYRGKPRYALALGLGAMLCSLFPFLWASGQSALEKDSGRAILMVKETPLRTAPDGSGTFIIHEGTALEILDQVGDWTKVRLRNSDVGWLRQGEYERI